MPLPFKCHMVGEAPAGDAVLGMERAADSSYEVVFPIAIPDEGSFEWLDDFLKKNPRPSRIWDGESTRGEAFCNRDRAIQTT